MFPLPPPYSVTSCLWSLSLFPLGVHLPPCLPKPGKFSSFSLKSVTLSAPFQREYHFSFPLIRPPPLMMRGLSYVVVGLPKNSSPSLFMFPTISFILSNSEFYSISQHKIQDPSLYYPSPALRFSCPQSFVYCTWPSNILINSN